MTLFALQLQAVAATAPRFTRLFSSTRAVRSGSLTVVVPASASKQSVLDRLKDAQDDLVPKNGVHASGEQDNAAVVLASPDLSSWLEDEAFMSSLLRRLPLSRHTESSAQELDPGVSVLGAVVDGLAVSPSGLSVLHGRSDTLLPGLWRRKDATAPRRGGRNSIYGAADVEAAITVELPSMRPKHDQIGSRSRLASSSSSSSSPLKVTVPLANTVFQNGRRSTLLASRWSWFPSSSSSSSSSSNSGDGEGTYKLMRKPLEELGHQLVVPCSSRSSENSHTSASVPLLAATEPRKIVAGLGNIVRQVVLDGKPSPASQELESAIPALLAARRKAFPRGADFDAATSDGPLGVWGLVVPPDALPLYDSLQGTLAPAADHSAEAEQRAATVAAPSLAALLTAGCRLHRILSGGGGWGQKQGLLSLDPQMSHPASSASASGGGESDEGIEDGDSDSDSDDAGVSMASFLRSLRGETEAPGSDNLATPGAHVQFFVAPLSAGDNTGSDADAAELDSIVSRKGGGPTPAIVLGAHPGYDGRPAAAQEGKKPAAVTLVPGHFGAVSNQGIFLAGALSDPTAGIDTVTPRTKLDAPYAFVWNE